ncbi:hypothetical protein BB559_002819 [Furculomyces boomerangus]|uniref:Uncharacterized protein n=2 Tax=Harpellales TaxID=61421 RepID=A0A2T9XXM4_9FUNG|nr:hypothetical protein BB559_007365 [Furculomyces boomerangus]PVU95187.1 hypothetical protein BB559_002819 [Furculomyces boomerangus]
MYETRLEVALTDSLLQLHQSEKEMCPSAISNAIKRLVLGFSSSSKIEFLKEISGDEKSALAIWVRYPSANVIEACNLASEASLFSGLAVSVYDLGNSMDHTVFKTQEQLEEDDCDGGCCCCRNSGPENKKKKEIAPIIQKTSQFSWVSGFDKKAWLETIAVTDATNSTEAKEPQTDGEKSGTKRRQKIQKPTKYTRFEIADALQLLPSLSPDGGISSGYTIICCKKHNKSIVPTFTCVNTTINAIKLARSNSATTLLIPKKTGMESNVQESRDLADIVGCSFIRTKVEPVLGRGTGFNSDDTGEFEEDEEPDGNIIIEITSSLHIVDI